MPFDDETFDAVLSNLRLHWINDLASKNSIEIKSALEKYHDVLSQMECSWPRYLVVTRYLSCALASSWPKLKEKANSIQEYPP